MDSKKPNKIREIVRLQQILKKWKKLATNKTTTTTTTINSTSNISSNNGSSSSSKSIKFLKKTLSFSDYSFISSSEAVPKGFLAVCVGKELKRFIIPTEYLGHEVFGMLLREAEEEFGFEQEGVLKIPCEVPLFEHILMKMVQDKRKRPRPESEPEPEPEEMFFLHHDHDHDHDHDMNNNIHINGCYSSPDCELTIPPHHPQLCR